MKSSNILDPIATSLDKNVFIGTKLRASIQKWVKNSVNDALYNHFGFKVDKLVHLYLTGSLTTYQYHDTSDFDVNIFVDYTKWPGKPEALELRKQILHVLSEKVDGKMVPKTKHPLQLFIIMPGIEPINRYDVGIRSAWSFDKRDWVIKPEKDRAMNVLKDLSPLYEKAMRMSEKMRVLLDQNPQLAVKLYDKLHAKRKDDEDYYGDFSESNIIYKFMESEGLFEKIKVLKTKVAQIKEAEWQDIEQKAKRYIEENRFRIKVKNDPIEEGGKIIYHSMADINGDTGIWETEIWLQAPYSKSLDRWSCTCPWGQNSWGRTRQWMKYEGRPCAHALGLYWQIQGSPRDYKQDLDQLVKNLVPTEVPPVEPQVTEETGETAWNNGDIIIVKPQTTIEAYDPGNMENRTQIPQNTVGQVLEQISPSLLRVIFPNPSGSYLENKVWEAMEHPNNFYRAEQALDPFVHRRTKVGMAERSGDPELDKLIEEFLSDGEYFEEARADAARPGQTPDELIPDWQDREDWGFPIEDLRDPQWSIGVCSIVSEEFINYLQMNGIRADWYDFPYSEREQHGYGDAQTTPGGETGYHCVVKVDINGSSYLVDWTPSQYGYTEFPMVQKLNNDQWQREWTSNIHIYELPITELHVFN